MRLNHLAWGAIALAVSFSAASAQPLECCQPWDNGGYDHRNAQTSQVGFGEDWRTFGRITADDFWLCEGNIYRIQTIRGRILTDSLVPKADVVILPDCDGLPVAQGEIARAYSVSPTNPADQTCNDGFVTITDTGEVTPDGFRVLEVVATFDRLWLRGGAYWVSIIGFSGTGDSEEQFFWGTAGNQVVKGRPGVFYDSELDPGGWVTIDQVCCGCTDFNFCVEGEMCKILHDNIGAAGTYSTTRYASSINNGNLAQDTRAADDIVIKDCADKRLCYVEGYLFSNCTPPRARLDIYDNACKLPATFSRPITFESQCIVDTGRTIVIDNRELKIYLVRFWDLEAFDRSPFILQRNKNYWFSMYGVGTGAQNQRAYFAGAERCDLVCDGRTQRFNQAAVSGRGVGLSEAIWRPVEAIYNAPFDLAFMAAVEPEIEVMGPPGVVVQLPPACPSDMNNDGQATLQDLFDYLAAYFTGCP